MATKDISLKAACADTFYYPQDWDPSKGTLDSFQRKRGFEHHFGKSRTKNLDKGILVIRFEMPFKVQCLRCNTYIGQGTRYDAEKRKVGMYFTSPIYEFAMRCGVITGHKTSADGGVHCNQRFVIRADPKKGDYEMVEGLRRKVETWDAKDAGNIELENPETRRQMESDPMFRAEKTIRDAKKERGDKERLADLQDLQDDREDTYALNCSLRRSHRVKRKELLALEEAERKAGKPNFALPLLEASAEDAREAASVPFLTDHDKVAVSARRAAAGAAPLFRKRIAASSGDRGEGAAKLMEQVAKRRRLAQHAHMAKIFGPA